MTVGELRKKIKNLPAHTPVYIVLDKWSDNAWDEDREMWRYAVPLAYVEKERLYDENMGDELNLLLEPESL